MLLVFLFLDPLLKTILVRFLPKPTKCDRDGAMGMSFSGFVKSAVRHASAAPVQQPDLDGEEHGTKLCEPFTVNRSDGCHVFFLRPGHGANVLMVLRTAHVDLAHARHPWAGKWVCTILDTYMINS